MISFISTVTLLIVALLIGRAHEKISTSAYVIAIVIAVVQVSIVLFDLYTMEIPTP